MHGSRFANVDFSTDEQSHSIFHMILRPGSMLIPSPKKLLQDIQWEIKHRFQLQKQLKEEKKKKKFLTKRLFIIHGNQPTVPRALNNMLELSIL